MTNRRVQAPVTKGKRQRAALQAAETEKVSRLELEIQQLEAEEANQPEGYLDGEDTSRWVARRSRLGRLREELKQEKLIETVKAALSQQPQTPSQKRKSQTRKEKFDRLRKRKSLSLAEVAAKARLNLSTVLNFRSGKHKPNPATTRALAEVLGTTPEELLE